MTNQSASSTVALPSSNQLALDRTRLAYERTLMAWVRTATSLISFGFTIYKFFQYLREEGELAHPHHLLGPREFALLMILIGLVALVLATFQHRNDIKRLRTYDAEAPYSLSLMLAILVIALGFFGLFAVFFRQ